MLSKKPNLVIGLTTFNNEMLRISIPALGKLNQKFFLIIYNDNPMTTVSKKQIRRLGYCGDLHIINSAENVGLFRGRINILNAIPQLKIKPDWIIFNDDDDIITDITVPNVNPENNAIIQNSVIIKHRVMDLLRVMDNPKDYVIDGENVVLSRPNVSFAGTLFRVKYLSAVFQLVSCALEDIKKIDESLDYMPPIDALMKLLFTIYSQRTGDVSVPIYMDKVNYIKIDLDSNPKKYDKLNHPVRNITDHYQRALSRYETAINKALDAVAPRG